MYINLSKSDTFFKYKISFYQALLQTFNTTTRCRHQQIDDSLYPTGGRFCLANKAILKTQSAKEEKQMSL